MSPRFSEVSQSNLLFLKFLDIFEIAAQCRIVSDVIFNKQREIIEAEAKVQRDFFSNL